MSKTSKHPVDSDAITINAVCGVLRDSGRDNASVQAIAEVLKTYMSKYPEKGKRQKKQTKREKFYSAMSDDEDKITTLDDALMFILKYTEGTIRYDSDLPFAFSLSSGVDEKLKRHLHIIDDFQYCVSLMVTPRKVLEEVFSRNQFGVSSLAPDAEFTSVFQSVLMAAVRGSAEDRLAIILEQINTDSLNVGSKEDFNMFCRRISSSH
jgi:hypothetical protein